MHFSSFRNQMFSIGFCFVEIFIFMSQLFSLINHNFISSLEGKISTKPLLFFLLRREIKVKILVSRKKNRALTKEAL